MSCPVFPKPANSKASLLKVFLTKSHSWLDALYEKSYRMKMGEYRLPGRTIFMVNQPELVKKILVTEVENYPKSQLMAEILAPLLGDSIFTTNGEQWRSQRNMLDPAFKQAKVDQVFSLMQSSVDAMSQRLAEKSCAGVFDIDKEMTFVTADIIFRTIMSTPLDEDDARKIFTAFEDFQRQSPKFGLFRLFKLPQALHCFFGQRERQRSAAIIRGAIERIVEPRFGCAVQAQAGCPDSVLALEQQGDILSSLLMSKNEQGKFFDFSEVVDQISMLFLAGHETSASALSWSLYLLATHPEIQQQAAEEAIVAFEQGDASLPVIKKLPLLKDVFKEALRLYPPVGFLSRDCVKDTVMRDKHMTTKDVVMISPWLIHRHHDYWHKPNDFDPHRFAADRNGQGGKSLPPAACYLPFGSGQRVCIGAAFAQQEALLILAAILKDHQLALAEGFTPKPVGRLTIRSKNGMRVRLTPRQSLPRDGTTEQRCSGVSTSSGHVPEETEL